MADIHSTNSNYVRYILFSEIVNPLVIEEPIGWSEDELELTRHKDYHGIFFTFTGGLKFYGQAKLYLLDAYEVLGVNAKVLLVKQRLREAPSGEVKFMDDYSAFADFKTMVVTEVDVTLNFNSYDLAELIKSHESDDFEMETSVDINGDALPALDIPTTTLEGRSLNHSNEHVMYPGSGNSSGSFTPKKDGEYSSYSGVNAATPLTRLVSDSGSGRISSVDAFLGDDIEDLTAGNMFFTAVDDTQQDLTSSVRISFSIDWYVNYDGPQDVNIRLMKLRSNQSGTEYVVVEDLYSKSYSGSDFANGTIQTDFASDLYATLDWNEALCLRMNIIGGATRQFTVYDLNIKVFEDSFFEPTTGARFMYTHDVGKRLVRIISGEAGSFYSKFFGRKGTEEDYTEDGEAGRIANISGLWVRGFVSGSDNYKSIQTNFKDWFESAKSTWNVGLGIDNVSNKERVRIEKLNYFYQNDVAIKLPNQISNVTRKVDASLFYSGIETGYQRGGDYSDEMGLDEPNTKSNWVTPIRKSDLKYTQISKFRADDYAMEETRRKPQYAFPDEDTQRDEAIWWLDMYLDQQTGGYRQATWDDDRLEQAPRYIYDPETFYGMRFTPQQMLFRHGWVIRAGLEKYTDKQIIYGSSKANNKLLMQFIGEPEYQANQNLFVSDLERSRVLPEIVEFDHAVDDELLDKVMGYTQINYDGSLELVRNFYFKVEYTNEFGKLEKGYLKSLKPKGVGKWVVQKSNEELLGDPGVPKVVRAFSCNFNFTACEFGEVDYPDILFFKADEGEYYPSLGQTIYSDSNAYELWADGSTKMSNGLGLVTNVDGASISFDCP